MGLFGLTISSPAGLSVSSLSLEDQKRSKILTAISWTSIGMIGLQMIFFLATSKHIGMLTYCVVLILIQTVVLGLNKREKHIPARVLFLVSAYPVLMSLPIYFGEVSHLHLYLIPAGGMPLIFFKNEIGYWKWVLSLIAFPCWFYINWHFILFDPMYDLPEAYIEGFQLINETFVVITATAMFVVFTRESDLQINTIETQNEQLTEFELSRTRSIEYANKIQRSIFPSQEKMDAILPHSFVFYQPKEIVGGDFYWVKEVGGSRYVATADCTGHGIPGALLAMMIQSHLDSIVKTEVIHPDEILTQLHQRVLKTLNTNLKKGGSYDGCDISIVHLKPDSTIEFAGANATLYAVSSGEVRKYKGDLASVGGTNFLGEVVPNQQYERHEIAQEANMELFLMTDGILDAHDDDGRDFGSNELKSLLIKLSEIEPYQGEEIIKQSLKRFLGETKPIDDLLFIGFRV